DVAADAAAAGDEPRARTCAPLVTHSTSRSRLHAAVLLPHAVVQALLAVDAAQQGVERHGPVGVLLLARRHAGLGPVAGRAGLQALVEREAVRLALARAEG